MRNCLAAIQLTTLVRGHTQYPILGGETHEVAGVQPRELIPTIPLLCMSFATVLRDTCSPTSRRSAKIRGDPYTWSESSWNLMILVVNSVRRCWPGDGPACSRFVQA